MHTMGKESMMGRLEGYGWYVVMWFCHTMVCMCVCPNTLANTLLAHTYSLYHSFCCLFVLCPDPTLSQGGVRGVGTRLVCTTVASD